MRSGLIISAVGHVAAVLVAVLFTGATPFNSVATEAISVDIISPNEVPPNQPEFSRVRDAAGTAEGITPGVQFRDRSDIDAAAAGAAGAFADNEAGAAGVPASR